MRSKNTFKIIVSLVLVITSFNVQLAKAELPVSVDGQQMPSLAPMVERVSPSVVNIFTTENIKVQDNPLFNDPFFRQFFEGMIPQQPRERKAQSLGTGVIIDADNGYIVTNNHVVGKADEISVQLEDGRKFDAKLIGGDEKADVAVIQIEDASNLTAIEVGDSDNLRVGDFVVALGNPFGLGHTVTSGIVSALGRSGLNIEEYENFIQTDASINPGNSGGALVDLNGHLVGINTAIIGRQGNVGIGFAIPVNMVNVLTSQLVEFGEVKRGQLGVYIQDLDPNLAEALGIKTQKGAVVTEVIAGTAAEKAGLQSGDVIVRLNNKEINSMADLRNYVGLIREGSEVEIEYFRGEDNRVVNAEIKSPKEVEEVAKKEEKVDAKDKLRGASLDNITDSLENGVLVTEIEPNSPAEKAGLQTGDIITAVNRQQVDNVEDIKDILDDANGAILLNIKRNGGARFLVIN